MKLQNFLLTLALAISSAALTTNASAQGKTRAGSSNARRTN